MTKRLLSTVLYDIRLQFRQGFYYASGFVAVVMVLLLRQISGVDMSVLWPAIIMSNLTINSFYFMAGLVLLEKGEGTLEAQIVTPLRKSEYLISKVLTLGLLSLIETVALVLLVSGFSFNWLWMLVGIILLIGIYALYGFWVVARYDSINEFIFPSVAWTLLYSLPLLHYFNIWPTPLMYLHPIQPQLVLLKAAFVPVPGWEIVYGLVYSLVVLGVTFYFSQRAFYRFVVRKEGVRA
ncbi:MAG: ABC transporter permease [Chloroflexi bacterium]|nr:MAG: ABC transporter permease [Chloroflexota bacterium]MBL1194674.1 ABC transporter permease [Chloroflexota bacterium]NOH11965.1 ABC transporter permease [Chloroflexota bacterium]